MNKFIKYIGYGVGILLLFAMVFPHLFVPTSVIGAMALGIYVQACQKNVSGASKIFIAESSIVTAITVVGGEITAITGTTPFMRIDAIQDSVGWSEKGERVGLNNWKYTNEVEFQLMPRSVALRTFMQALIDGSPCGLLAIVQDGNGKAWVVGHNATDVKSRPLRMLETDDKTGKGLSEADGNTVIIKLQNECSGFALPLDATLTTALLAGSATFVKWV